MNASIAHKVRVTVPAYMARVTTYTDPTIVPATQATRVNVVRSTMMIASPTSAKMAESVVTALEDIRVSVRVVSTDRRVTMILTNAHPIRVKMEPSVTSM